MVYERVQKDSSSWNPAFHHQKSESLFRSRPFSIPAEADTDSAEEQEIPAYSRADRDAISAKLLKSMEAYGKSQAETQSQKPESKSQEKADEMSNEAVSLQRLSESPSSGDEDDNSPNGGTRERVCDKCESQLHGQPMEDEKSDAEVSLIGRAIQRQEESSLSEDDEMKPVQTKLTIGAPGDKYEQEADQTAAKVMAMPDSAIQQPIQRQTASEKEEVQMKLGVQRSAASGSTQASASIESRLASQKGGGRPLPDEVRSFMEPRFGVDFSAVRVHTDSSAVQMNKELGAQAFAHGNDIYFGAGKSPGKNDLTAHELTHTIQQTGGAKPTAQMKTEVIQRFAPAAAAPAIAFGPVGLTVAVGIVGVTIVVLWLNNGGWEEIGRITDAIGKGINGTLEELREILGRAGEGARARLREIEDYIGTVFQASEGNQADTGIMAEANKLISDGEAEDICEALDILMAQAKALKDNRTIQRIKKTQKAKGCRHSRHS